MAKTQTFTIVPTGEHPSGHDPAATTVWLGQDRDQTRRHLPCAYRVQGGYLLTWSEPSASGEPWRGSAVLELFGSVTEAQAAWRVLGAEVQHV